MWLAMRAAVIHFFGIDFGAPYGHWVPYNFWSGVAGSFVCSVIGSLVTFMCLFYVHHVCNYSFWCPRWGHTTMAGGQGRVCHRHHPERDPEQRGRLRGPALHAAHADWLERQ